MQSHTLAASARGARAVPHSPLIARTHRARPPPGHHHLVKAAPGDSSSSTPDLAALAAEALAADPAAQAQLDRVREAATRVAALQQEQARLAKALKTGGGAAGPSPALAAAQAAVQAREVELEVATAAAALGRAQAAAAAAEANAGAAAAAASTEADRLESAKAGAAGAAGAALAALPYALTAGATAGPVALASVLSVLAAGGFGLLMGITYRYAVREDAANRQLAAGAAAAFGLVRAIGGADALQAASTRAGGSPLDLASVIGPAALGAGQAVLGAAFAAAAVEAGFRAGWVSRMGNGSGGGGSGPPGSGGGA